MQIKETVLETIQKSVSGLLYETGGILGSTDGVVTAVVMDKPNCGGKCACSYEPDVAFLNECIESWTCSGTEFEGVFHTHFANVRTLSAADIKYITQIMKAMPESVERLCFPVFTLPEGKLNVYSATLSGEETEIKKERLDIVK